MRNRTARRNSLSAGQKRGPWLRRGGKRFCSRDITGQQQATAPPFLAVFVQTVLSQAVLFQTGLFFAVVACGAPTDNGLNRPGDVDLQSNSSAASPMGVNGEPPDSASGRDESGNSAVDGMVWIEGGNLQMGSPDGQFDDAIPVHRVSLDGFWMDRTEVTNEQYAAFVAATGYVTVAERTPQAEDYPGVPVENLIAGSIVFSPPVQAVPLDHHGRWWSYVAGANWRHPEGPASDLEGRWNHPVVHVAWEDVMAYAEWANKRVPTEAEWEWAARGGLEGLRFIWGDELTPDETHHANTFQGNFPNHNTKEDGYAATNPVDAFPANGFGLLGMAGNVWEWTQDWYRPDTYARRAASGDVSHDPQGPTRAQSWDPSEPGLAKRVQRGGSFLCTDQYCTRYRPDGRGKGAEDSGTNHLGFRLVRDP